MGIDSIVICVKVKGKLNKERLSHLKARENASRKRWINVYSNREKSEAVQLTIILYFYFSKGVRIRF